MEEVIQSLEHVDHIFSDPPYLYIKTHAFDKEFDETILFENAKRILPDKGFIVLFGRGTSFYRWNTRLAELGFMFKEEIVWNKRRASAPCIALSRVHETISIHTRKSGKIRRVKVPYIEQKQYDIGSIIEDIKQIKRMIGTDAGLERIKDFLCGGELYTQDRANHYCVTQKPGLKTSAHGLSAINSTAHGMNERSIVNGGWGVAMPPGKPRLPSDRWKAQMIKNGMREKSIVEVPGRHYHLVHPTEKPVRLAERIIALISDPGDIIYDPFMGSGSIGVACVNTGRTYIGSEIIPEYFKTACERIAAASKREVSDV